MVVSFEQAVHILHFVDLVMLLAPADSFLPGDLGWISAGSPPVTAAALLVRVSSLQCQ